MSPEAGPEVSVLPLARPLLTECPLEGAGWSEVPTDHHPDGEHHRATNMPQATLLRFAKGSDMSLERPFRKMDPTVRLGERYPTRMRT